MLTDDWDLYNPIKNEKLIKYDSMKKLLSLNCELDYDEILGFNKIYRVSAKSKFFNSNFSLFIK